MKIKRYAITGHTKRIGKAICEAFPSVGFSKSNGYDITNKEDRLKIIKKSADCDIFINNAHEGFGQVFMLSELFEAWRMEEKMIINIGVDTVPYTNWQVVHKQYPVEKVALHAQCSRRHPRVSVQRESHPRRIVRFSTMSNPFIFHHISLPFSFLLVFVY